LRSRIHSSLCCFVTLTVRLENLSTSSVVPTSLASSPSSLASSRRANRFESSRIMSMRGKASRANETYHSFFQFWRLSVKHIRGFDTILYYPYSPIKEAHKMTRGFSCIVGQHFTVALTNGYEELVNRHGRVNSDFSTEKCFNVVLLDGIRSVLGYKTGQTFDTHGKLVNKVESQRDVTSASFARRDRGNKLP